MRSFVVGLVAALGAVQADASGLRPRLRGGDGGGGGGGGGGLWHAGVHADDPAAHAPELASSAATRMGPSPAPFTALGYHGGIENPSPAYARLVFVADFDDDGTVDLLAMEDVEEPRMRCVGEAYYYIAATGEVQLPGGMAKPAAGDVGCVARGLAGLGLKLLALRYVERADAFEAVMQDVGAGAVVRAMLKLGAPEVDVLVEEIEDQVPFAHRTYHGRIAQAPAAYEKLEFVFEFQPDGIVDFLHFRDGAESTLVECLAEPFLFEDDALFLESADEAQSCVMATLAAVHLTILEIGYLETEDAFVMSLEDTMLGKRMQAQLRQGTPF